MTCKLTYTQLKELKARADFNHDLFWDEQLYDLALKYARIAKRIQQAICDIPAVNEFKK